MLQGRGHQVGAHREGRRSTWSGLGGPGSNAKSWSVLDSAGMAEARSLQGCGCSQILPQLRCCRSSSLPPLQGAPRSHGPSTFDLQMKFVCGQCWRNGQVVEPDKDLKYCSAKARHW